MVVHATLGGVPFRINPNSVKWTFQMKVSQIETVGGRVVQIFGTELGDMQVSGVFGNGDKSKGDTEGWQDQVRFAERVKAWTEAAQNNGKPLRFVYAPKKWDFHVFIKAYTNPEGRTVNHDVTTFNPKWTLTLFIVEDRTGVVTKGIQDVYIQRLFDGIGWKQTAYNGPLQEIQSGAVAATIAAAETALGGD